MADRNCDIALVGGGLSGGLIALALARHRPELTVSLFEAGDRLGGHHRWSWFESDLTPEGAALLDGFRLTRWERGYDVCFPGVSRHLGTRYRSLASVDFAQGLENLLAKGTIRCGTDVRSLDRHGVTLAGAERVTAGAVIDCRGFEQASQLSGGWQVFMGRHIHTAAPHGIEHPVIMDADVEQIGGYRFVYVLPLGPNEIFVEDTYYQDEPTLDRKALSARIDAYCQDNGWTGETVDTETGVLPVITGGDFAAFQHAQRIEGVGVAGARGGFAHPLTSYTLPFAVETALAIAKATHLSGEEIAILLEQRARHHWRSTRFYRKLGVMLFRAARPEDRWQIFDRFYRLDRRLIERFYAGRSTRADKARILCGRPPVPVHRAVKAVLGAA
ncbi:lycopene beta-cyclase CrtY [Croceibacterium sp. LX-88]|uniref:Lycopene beta-cyclase CrtY n=1 Tax=Croceibacterium selenioxidans TaxID=2838833 RepID=A0ABS5VYX5_9SPHN|nr:lycopene beta-cyclase CrtY [Croceibacterium selenioxidans]MBT2132725.1 lycopene beta-cyclase CrtY [Croceibacterium selenioxidans]